MSCHNLSFWVFFQFSLSHNLCFWVLSQFKCLGFVTIWGFEFCQSLSIVTNWAVFTIWVFAFCHNLKRIPFFWRGEFLFLSLLWLLSLLSLSLHFKIKSCFERSIFAIFFVCEKTCSQKALLFIYFCSVSIIGDTAFPYRLSATYLCGWLIDSILPAMAATSHGPAWPLGICFHAPNLFVWLKESPKNSELGFLSFLRIRFFSFVKMWVLSLVTTWVFEFLNNLIFFSFVPNWVFKFCHNLI